MPSSRKRVENVDRQFRVDYKKLVAQTDDEKCWLVQMSDTTLNLCLSLGRFIQWGTRWHNLYDEQGNPVSKPNFPLGNGPIDDIIHNYFSELNMACNADNLGRIADNLEMLVKLDDTTTVTRSITEVLAGGAGGADFDELIDAIDDQGSGVGTSDLKDWLEMMTYVKTLMPNIGGPSLFAILKGIMEMRFRHNVMGQLQLINSNMRYMGLALAPQKTGQTAEDEETFIGELYTGMDIVPWLTTGVAALAEPTPAGETVMAGLVAKTVGKAMVSKLIDYIWGLFDDDPDVVPEGSIVGMLEKIANAAGGGTNTTQNLTLQEIITNISTVVDDNDVVDYPDIYASLTQIFDFLPDEYQDSYKIPDPSGLIQAAILDRSMNGLKDELAIIHNKLAPDEVNNISNSLQAMDIQGIVDQLVLLVAKDTSVDFTSVIQQLTILANRVAPADENLKAAIEALDLSVDNTFSPTFSPTVPVPSVTVDPTPINIDLSTVNEMITNLSNNLALIKNEWGTHLGNIQTQTGVIGVGTNLASLELPKLVSELSDVAQKMEDLQCICEQLGDLVDTAQIQDPGTIVPIYTNNTPDAYKCDASKWLLGKIYADTNYLHQRAVTAMSTAFDIIGELFDTAQFIPILGTLVGAGVEIIVDIVEKFSVNDLQYMVTMLNANRSAFLCDLYEAISVEDAEAAFMSRLDTIITGDNPVNVISANIVDLARGYIFNTGAASRLFLPDGHELRVTQEEIDVYAGWTNDDCSSCSPAYDFSCMPRGGAWTYGSPHVLSGVSGSAVWNIGSYPVNTWVTVTSEPDSNGQERVGLMTFDDAYTVEIEILSMPTSGDLRVVVRDCLETDILDGTYSQTGPVIISQMGSLLVHSDDGHPGSYQVRIRRTN